MENGTMAAGNGRKDAAICAVWASGEDAARTAALSDFPAEGAGMIQETDGDRKKQEEEIMASVIRDAKAMTGIVQEETSGAMVSLDELAAQMRLYSDGARGDYQHMMMNLLQFGRVMMEAKGRVGHGKWRDWVEENSGFSLRTAESYMQAYQEFGLNPDIAKLGKSKVIQLLPVPEDVREKVLAEHDVEHMSAREFKKLLKDETEKARAEARAAAWAEAGDRMSSERESIREQMKNEALKDMEAERTRILADGAKIMTDARNQIAAEREKMRAEMAAEIEDARNAVPDEVMAALEEKERRIQEQNSEIQRLAAQAKETMEALKSGTGDLQSENGRLTRELRDAEEGLKDLQEQYERVQNEYLNLQSTIQKGDAERAPADELTPEVFSGAVRSFIGTVARMPQMAGVFSRMDADGRETFDTLLKTIEEWARGARRALDTFGAEGGVLA